jgi:carbonic anhydrase
MTSIPQSPGTSGKVVTAMGLALLLRLPLLAQPSGQSPVDIIRPDTVRNPNPPRLEINYGIGKVTLKNTYGSTDEAGRVLAQEWGTLKAFPAPGSEVRLNGVPYDLIQFHFHMPAEHIVNGHRAAMEIHFVHLIRNSQGPAAACASSNRPLLVIGAFIEAAGNSDTELQRLFPAGLPKNTTDPAVEVPNVDLRALLPSGSPIWQYDGGLTAPANDCPNFPPLSTQAVTGDFPEAVHWFLYDKALHLPQISLDRYAALFPGGDSRSVKALGNRTILSNPRNDGPQ